MRIFYGLAIALAISAAPRVASSAPVVLLDASNVGIDAASFSFSVVGTTITINETWTSNGIGSLLFRGLDVSIPYTVVKQVTNNTGASWTRFANELLDPAGQANDAADLLPYPSFVPAGYTTSNDSDGLSFNQGGGSPRTSLAFSDLLVDELTDARDFLDFFNGSVSGLGGLDTITFGLIDTGPNQPFLLVQRPNEKSVETPEPISATILGMGLLGLGFARRRRG